MMKRPVLRMYGAMFHAGASQLSPTAPLLWWEVVEVRIDSTTVKRGQILKVRGEGTYRVSCTRLSGRTLAFHRVYRQLHRTLALTSYMHAAALGSAVGMANAAHLMLGMDDDAAGAMLPRAEGRQGRGEGKRSPEAPDPEQSVASQKRP